MIICSFEMTKPVSDPLANPPKSKLMAERIKKTLTDAYNA
jgi:hypothetical protein